MARRTGKSSSIEIAPPPEKKPQTRKTTASASRAGKIAAAAQGAPAAAADGARGSVRIYRQGLGDCILVQIKRQGRDDFKLLIDCGVVLGTSDPATCMTRVVEDIVAVTHGYVDVFAITHEHWDHVSGLLQAPASFAKLKVGEVWLGWTEDPDDPLAQQLKSELGKAEAALAASGAALQMAGDEATAKMLQDVAATSFGAAVVAGATTKAALEAAKALTPKPPRLCRPSDDPFEIPGADARIFVLAPPHDPVLIRKINPSKSNPETYALAMNGAGVLPLGVAAALGLAEDAGDSAPFHPRVSIPLDSPRLPDFFRENYLAGEAWRRIDADWLAPTADLALALQSYTNNTSLVLAMEVGEAGSGDVLLFAADAQVGNWESWQDFAWPKTEPKVTGSGLLSKTIFYKVGHHGSHNATLRQHGLEQMTGLRTAVIPVDEAMAKKKRWGQMPLPLLIDALNRQIRNGAVLRTDQTPTTPVAGATVSADYFEITF